MKKDNEKGFALVLSLVLLLVMSLMGGSLIVISSGDHQNNDTSDKYQQAFYVAETALLEGEKYIINQFLGPRTPPSATREISKRNKPINANDPGKLDGENYTDCYNSFPGLPKVEDNEKETVVLQRRAVRATRKIHKGEKLERNMIEFQRPCPRGAMKPNEFATNVGKTLKSDILEGECLNLSELS